MVDSINARLARRKQPLLALSIPTPGASNDTKTNIPGPSQPSSPPAPITPAHQMEKYHNIKRGETYEASFQRARPDIPSEILPGLYLGNAKTAAAYLTGKLDNDEQYPAIGRIVTILTDGQHYGYPALPSPRGAGRSIKRLELEKLDHPGVNLIEDFDTTGEFIHAGVLEYNAAKDKLARSTDIIEMMSPAIDSLLALKLRDERSRSPTGRLATGTAPTPPTPSRIPQRPNKSPTTSSTSATPTSRFTFRSTKTLNLPRATSPTKPAPNRPHSVLVHCHAGISRSATIIIAYLLKHHAHLFRHVDARAGQFDVFHPVNRALRFVQRQRDCVNPNWGFMQQLRWYADKLGCELTEPSGTDDGKGERKFKKEFLKLLDIMEDEEMRGQPVRGMRMAGRSVFAAKMEREHGEGD